MREQNGGSDQNADWREKRHPKVGLGTVGYLGQWQKLPSGWGSGQFSDKDLLAFDEFGRNVDRVISPRAYKEGLAWRAVGVNPMGAKQPGFGSWQEAPK